jgi:hypothetical protein
MFGFTDNLKSSQKLENDLSPRSLNTSLSKKSSGCCTTLLFLEMVCSISIAFHLLCTAVGTSMLHHQAIASPHAVIQLTKDQAIELLVMGVTGTLVNLLALIGLWHKYRHFLLPLVLFLIIDIILDAIYVFAYCVSVSDPAMLEQQHPLSALSPGNLSKPETMRSLLPVLAFKMVFSLILAKLLMYVYKRDLTIRTGRSPLRKRTNGQAEEAGEESSEAVSASKVPTVQSSLMKSEEKVPKLGQYHRF